jgi:hypothetical protein
MYEGWGMMMVMLGAPIIGVLALMRSEAARLWMRRKTEQA